MKHGRSFIALHALLLVCSFTGVCSKLASHEPLFSDRFFFFYAISLALMAFYGLIWQQIIKKMPLTTAFANKAVSIVWGLVWGTVIFHESVTPGKIFGAALATVGVVLFSQSDGKEGKT